MFKTTIYTLWSMVVLALLPTLLLAQTNSDQLWSEIRADKIPETGKRYIKPKKAKTYKLNVDAMRVALDKAPMTKTKAVQTNPAYLELPWPDGTMKVFQIIEAPIMEPELMAKFPEIKTYKGSDVSDPSKYIRLDLTPQGFHAIVLTAGEGTVYIDPYSFGGEDIEHYQCYFKHDFTPIAGKTMVCGVKGDPVSTDGFRPSSNNGGPRFGSCELRTYRLALAATGEYTTFHGGTLAQAQAAEVTTINRVNSVYERDMAITFTIVANNNLIVYTNAATDPYTNGNTGAMINEVQTNIDGVIGSANYDVGHVFGTNSGGLAGLGVICSNGQKARGVTGSGAPVGDPFDIDYVCHELGHQFGANHTQNNSCQRNGPTAMEPGSASTIMGYAGICAPNVQSNSDDHFHGVSLEEISNRILATSCPVTTALSNNAPTITGTNGNVTIPASTPFSLTATATDPDGNTLSYCWEQMDNQVATMPPVATSTGGPNFRSFSPTTSPTRYFPNLAAIAAGTTPTWEVLPSVNRTMNFRVTVRDNAVGGGCTTHSDVTLTVAASAGPFIVTYPSATGITWAGASNETVTWNVANTDIAPVACANVNILLSTDGGVTYPTVLASNVPNNGSRQITVPNVATTTARIMVVCANGTFFDISDNNFTITAATLDYTLGATSDTATACQPNDATYTINVGQIGSYTDPVTLALTGLPAGATANFSTNPVTPAGTTTLTITNTGAAAAGGYNLTLTGNSTSGNKNYPLVLNIGGIPGAVTLTAPANGGTNIAVPTPFTWTGSGVAGEVYEIDIATDAGFTNIVDNATNLSTAAYTSNGLSLGTNYFWRIRASNPCGTGAYSGTFSFTTGSCATFMSSDVPKTISPTAAGTITSTLNIPITGTLSDVNVVGLAGTHTYIQDLIVNIASPAATSVNLWTNICNNEDDFNINFDDAAASATLPCPPTGGGTFQPNGTLANFNGQAANGTWTLSVNDNFNQDGGALNAWGLEVCIAVPTCAATATTTNVNCNGQSTGTATATSTGTAPFTFAWNNGQNTATATGLAAATYTVTVTDATGCTATATAVVAEPSPLAATATTTDESCAGNDGTATMSALGGTTPYTYAWSNGQNTITATGLTAAGYGYTVTDANGCTSSGTATVVDGCVPCTVTATITSSTNVLCGGSSTGAATAGATSGTAPYTFVWSNGQNTATATGLAAATYTVTVTDANGCTSTTTTAITEPSALTGTASTTAITCAGNDGTATATAAGGTAPYTYAWSNGQNLGTATSLAATAYTYTITDANGCTFIGTATVANGCGCNLTATISASANVTCNGGNNGTATVSAGSGTPPYTYAWNNGQNTATATGLSAATYTVIATDANGCTATATANITEPTALVATNSTTAETCAGNDGTATVTSTGGTAPYTYVWNNGQVTATATGLTAATYNYTVTDANGCTNTGSATVADGCACNLVVTIGSTSNVTCNGNSDGTATAVAASGTAPYTYAWSNGQNAATATGLSAATYTVTATDANGCTSTATTVVTAPAAPLNGLITGTSNPLCHNDATGTITVNAFGGTPTYSYDIGGGAQATGSFTNLTGGAYTVTITDANGCSITTSTALANPAAITAAATITNPIACGGNTNGSIALTANGGTGSLTYLWNNGATSANIAGLGIGNYTATITDANGCTTTSNTINLTGPAPIVVNATATTTISCPGGADGAAAATATGGTGALTYQWSNGQIGTTIGTLFANTYTVSVTDANGCQGTTTVTLTDPAAFVVSSTVNTNYNGFDVSCAGASDGSATIAVTGGTGPYTYLWNPSGQTSATAAGLPAASYSVIITDANGCATLGNVSLTAPTALTSTAVDNGDGTATASASGGTAPYTYQWGTNANNQTTETATGLINNTMYTVTITDANGCITTANVVVIISGLDNVPQLSLFDVIPNPNTGRFNIRVAFTEAKEATVQLTNVLGQVLEVYEYNETDFNIPIDVQEQASGVYFVTLQTGNQRSTRKVIVTK